ncbi:hypothetical protein F53441_7201 [Fusarium austroafricanum]|uniref:DUF7587 domain-containing protein n=1 Tax=Fusarium austroafricanum TaxID=2364996 RepID=A0A8H4KE49_9HYPO|nr:hypothetical protein F53441_7201 [Fusarium austroafricanum]
MSPSSVELPRMFYRVQHQNSFTIYDETKGFESQGHYFMGYDHWVNARNFHEHLNWRSTKTEYTPFISVFDNREDALARVQVLGDKGRKGIFIAEISSQSLTPMSPNKHTKQPSKSYLIMEPNAMEPSVADVIRFEVMSRDALSKMLDDKLKPIHDMLDLLSHRPEPLVQHPHAKGQNFGAEFR